jgi:protein-L-isoaspartate(D-aspartate) O-methyltransferase
VEHSPDAIPTLVNNLADALLRMGAIRSPAVEAAFRSVPRHLFLPDTPLEQIYSDNAVTTKRASDGQPLSSSTQPSIMAGMLEQLQIEPGHRVLEIGAGTGYNAALMAHIAGPAGQVVTLDVDDDIVADARRHLTDAGYSAVQVMRRDGTLGYPDAAPYDRIILTVGAQDIAPAWREQLAPGGRIVLPLVLRSRQRSIAFDYLDGVLTSSSIRSGIVFIPLRDTVGASHNIVPVTDDGSIFVEIANADRIDTQEMVKDLTRPAVDVPAGIPAATRAELMGLAIWLELHDPDFCNFYGRDLPPDDVRLPELIEEEGFRSTFGRYKDGSLALLRRLPEEVVLDEASESSYLLGIRGRGPDQTLVERLLALLGAWERAGRPGENDLRIRAYRSETVRHGTVSDHAVELQKQWTRLICAWHVESTNETADIPATGPDMT